jgi:thioesterase domain-containing protein
VVRTHASLLHRAWVYREASGIGEGGVQALMAPLSHVGAESDLFGAWMNGAQVSHYPASLGVGKLTDWLVGQRVAFWHPPVGLLRRWLGLIEEPLQLPALRLIALGGELIYWSDVKLIRRVCGEQVRILHRYSSSEAGNISAYEVGASSEGVVPAGFACPDKEVTISSQGEVIVSSPYLSRGYWKGSPFGQSYATGDLGHLDEQGCLHLKGRSDRRVKVRGFLVDLEEVEGVLQSLEGVREAAVIADQDRLLAYVVSPPPDIQSQAKSRLAPWMLPSAFIALAQMPLTSTGKVDRKALPLPVSEGVKPQPGLEEKLVELWRIVLGRDQAGATDHFFELGGDSLRAAELAARISRLVEREISTKEIYWAPTPAMMRLAIEENQSKPGNMVPLVGGEGEPWLLMPPPPMGTTYYQDLPALIGTPVYTFDLKWSAGQTGQVAEIIAAELKAFWPGRKLRLAGYSFGGNLAVEVAKLLGDQVELVVVFDSSAPGFVSGREMDHGLVGNRVAVLGYMLHCWWFEIRTWLRLRGAARRDFARATVGALKSKFSWRFIGERMFTEAPKPYLSSAHRHRASSDYRGRLHVIRFSVSYPGTPKDPFLGWGRWAENISGETVEGIHLRLMFLSPWAGALARALRRLGTQD